MKSLHKKVLAFLIAICLFTSSVISSNQSMLVRATDSDSTEATPVSLEGFQTVTTSDFETSSQEDMREGAYPSPETFSLKDKENFHKTLLTLKVTFTDLGHQSRIEFCGMGADKACFFVYPYDATQFALTKTGTMTTDDPFTRLSIEGTSVTSTINEEILLQISIEYKDYNSDETIDEVQLGFYFNGTKIETKDVQNCNMANFGNCLTVYTESPLISVYGVQEAEDDSNTDDEVEEIQACYLEDFKLVTTSSFVNSNGQMADTMRYEAIHSYSMRNLQTNKVDNFDKTLLSLKVKFEGASEDSRIQIAGKDADHAFLIYTDTEGQRLVFTQSGWDENNRMAEDTFGTFSAETAGVTSFLDNEFVLQISFEYGNYDNGEKADDLKLGFYFNGALYDGEHKIKHNCNLDNHGNELTVSGTGAPITVSSVVPTNSSLTELTWSDFNRAGTNKTAVDQIVPVMENKDDVDVYYLNKAGVDHMENTSYETKLMFEKAGLDNRVWYAGILDQSGIILHAWSNGNLWLQSGKPDLDVNADQGAVVIDKDIAGVGTFVNKEFTLRITTEFGDYDGDGDENDVQLGLYFNDKLYNNQYLYAYDCKDDFGNYMTLHPGTGCISVRSTTDAYEEVIQDVWDAGSYEFEETEEEILVNGEMIDESSLSIPGDYLVAKGDANSEKVILYSEYDPHPDDSLDVRDLIATVKVCNGVPVNTWSGNLAVYAAGMDADSVRDRLLNSMDNEESKAYSIDFIGGKDVMPIAGYCGPHRAYQDEARELKVWYPNFISDEYYKKLSDAGVNLIAYSEEDYNNGINNGTTVIEMLEYGNKYGIGHFLTDSNIRNRIGSGECEDIVIADGVATIKDAATLRAADSEDLDITGEMTIFMKVKIDGLPNNSTKNITLLSKGGITSKAYSMGIHQYSGGGLWFSSNGYQHSNSGNFPTAQWREVAVVVKHDGSYVNASFYIASDSSSGIKEDTQAITQSKENATGLKANNAPLYVGNYTVLGLASTDSVREYDDIRIYNKALTVAQIASITPNEADTDTTLQESLVAHWDFVSDGTEGSELKDKASSGTKNDDLSIYDANNTLCAKPDLTVATLQERIANYSNYDSFCGMYLVDEPTTEYYQPGDGTKNISNYKNLANVLQNDLGLTVFANMFPIWNLNQNQSAYEQYVEEFCESLRPKFLSWDNYPFESNEDLNVYFYNMSLVREKAQKYQIPFWATIQAGGQFSVASTEGVATDTSILPTKGEFNWNVNTCLAFGVQGLDYYPLIQPIGHSYAPNGEYDYSRNGVIGADGSLNNWYYYAQEINTHIKAIDKVLMNSVNKGVIASGEQAKTDTASTTCVIKSGQFRELQSASGEAIIGCFNYNGKTALYVVNHNRDNTENITLNFDKERHVKVVRSAKSSFVCKKQLQLDLAAGEGALLIIE